MRRITLLLNCILLLSAGAFAQKGAVTLIGAGPGDPDLITMKGIKALKQADVVLYDALANPSILLNCKRNVQLIPVGKRAGKPSPSQQEINKMLIEEALKGKNVARLKGGDPFVFGRGGEELIALLDAGIIVNIVPGITAAIAAPAYAGIPATHRALARSFTLVTASTKDSDLSEAIHWKSMVDQGGTIAFYMGVRMIPRICQELIKAGMPEDMPAAIISKGTLPVQKTFKGKLKDFTPDYCDYSQLTPGLLIVGEVVEAVPNYEPEQPTDGARVLSITLNRSISELTPRIEDNVSLAFTIPCKFPDAYSKDFLELLKELNFTHFVFSNTKSTQAFFELCEKKGVNIIGNNAKLITLGDMISNKLKERGYKEVTTLKSYNDVALYLVGDKAIALPSNVDAITGATKNSK